MPAFWRALPYPGSAKRRPDSSPPVPAGFFVPGVHPHDADRRRRPAHPRCRPPVAADAGRHSHYCPDPGGGAVRAGLAVAVQGAAGTAPADPPPPLVRRAPISNWVGRDRTCAAVLYVIMYFIEHIVVIPKRMWHTRITTIGRVNYRGPSRASTLTATARSPHA